MANVIYTTFLQKLANGGIDFDDGAVVVRAALERSTSTYSANKDHEFMDDLTSFVECTVASYARQTVANKAVNLDTSNDRIELIFDDVAFGTLESGQTVKGIVLYVQTGGNDASPEDDSLICYIDTATNLPAVLADGPFTVVINAEGLIQIAQA